MLSLQFLRLNSQKFGEMSGQIFLVKIHSGKWNDFSEDVLRAYSSKEEAEKFAQLARKRLNDIGRHIEGNNDNSKDARKQHQISSLNGFKIHPIGAWISVSRGYDLFQTCEEE